jgi:DNA-binding MarR family transcriptional regulator
VREPPAEFQAYFALLEVAALVQHGVERQLRESGGLSFVQFQILAVLGEAPDGSRTMTAVADRLVHSRSGLTYQVQQLEKAGLVARRAAPGDDRSTLVALTPSGRELLQRVLPGHTAVVREIMLDPLSAADREDLTGLLDKVRRHMRARPPRSATPPPGSAQIGRPHG